MTPGVCGQRCATRIAAPTDRSPARTRHHARAGADPDIVVAVAESSWSLLLLGSLPHSSTGANKRLLNQMLREKPDLHFVRADHIAHQQVIRPIIASLGGLLGHRSGLKQNDLVRME